MSGKKKTAAAVRRPRPAPRPFIDARLLLLAALIASPAAYRSSQGLLSPSDALDRFLLIAAGCLVLSAVLRMVWPLVVGESTPLTPSGSSGSSGSSASSGAPALEPTLVDDGMTLPPVGSGLDLLEDVADPTSLLDLP
ncbi:MAG TPA: hypothetical protein VN088_00990 [Nocardioides sp.]|nr:hypothetical protein [Nocardioides sp.]